MDQFVLLVVLLILCGGVCGFIAVFTLAKLKDRMTLLENQVRELSRQREAPSQPETAPSPLVRAPQAPTPPPTRITPPPQPREPLQPPPIPSFDTSSSRSSSEWTSLEVTIGAKWFNWVGVILVVVGVMFFLKYAYDNNWIGPAGRIAIAAVAGVAALVGGERFRRASYPVLFQTLSGGGLAVFYGCIYFSFQVYGLAGQGVSFALAVVVTALAIVLSVIHDAPGICLLGQFGGFLSPVLISTGENHPVALFSFVTILNIATVGCAYLKNWRLINAAGFIGTWALYGGWANEYYDESQLGIALFFSALFYLIFLTAPMLQAFSRRRPLLEEDLWLVSAVIFVEFLNNYALLYDNHRPWLGVPIVLQALTLCALYAQWSRGLVEDSKTQTTLLIFALALVTTGIPIELRFYAVPIGWSVEAVMLGYVGQQYKSWPFQLASVTAVGLAAMALISRLPLHSAPFTPVFNRPFGSWATVIGMTFALHAILNTNKNRLQESLREVVSLVGAIALVLACALAHMEVAGFWSARQDLYPRKVFLSYQFTSLSLLWAALPLLFLWLGRRGYMRMSGLAASGCYFMGIMVLGVNLLDNAWIDPSIPFFNLQWLSRFCIVLSLWIGVKWMQSTPDKTQDWDSWASWCHALEAAGHVLLVFLLFVEVNSWVSSSGIFSPFMRFGFVSALWSLQALVLIGLGLMTRSQFRRILGFILFGTTVAKLLLIDMAVLQPVYRILSFAATGALLIVAAYLYQRFAKALLDSSDLN